MKKNVGISDRIIRFVIVDLLLGLSFLGFDIPPLWASIAFIVSVMLVISIITAYSPLYQLFGWNTRDKKIDESGPAQD